MKRFTGKVSFIKKKDGSIHARGIYRCPDSNKRKDVWRKITGAKSDAKAKVINEIEKRLNAVAQNQKEYTFNDLADYYIENHAIPAVFVDDVKVAGMKGYKNVRSDIRQLRKAFGETLIKNINRDDISIYRQNVLKRKTRRKDNITGQVYYKPVTHSTANHHLRTLRAMLETARTHNWLDKTPSFKRLIQGSIENVRLVIPTRFEFQRILDACVGYRAHVASMAVFMADTGSRPIEMFNLKWEQVNFIAKTIILRSDKGNKRTFRELGMTDRVYGELEKLRENKVNEYVFGGIQSIKRAWNNIQRIAQVPHLDFYTLRHLFASRIVHDHPEISIFQLQELLGHTQLETTAKYVKQIKGETTDITTYLNEDSYLPIQESDALN